MAEERLVTTPLTGHFKLSFSQCPNSQGEEDETFRVPYASVVGSLMYTMVCTRLNLAYSKSVHVELRQATLGSSEVRLRYLRGTAIGVSKIDNRKALQIIQEILISEDLQWAMYSQ